MERFTLIPAYSAQYLLAPTDLRLKPSVVFWSRNQTTKHMMMAMKKP